MKHITIHGTVVQGKHMGHRLGFPTANVQPDPGQQLPENGVYIAELKLHGEQQWRRCVVNQGMQPTLPSGRATIEAFILDFHRDIYGERLTLRFLALLRHEHRFDSIELLIEQLGRDEQDARAYQK
ncbi:riboflavin kinase [Eubacteriales bacterium OttesenSCG-928-N13]|nr:riboflavin kinase [Eubacteriales bacterium OttesenSCG-928-N13]